MSSPSQTPNVVVQDPRVRKVVGNILAWATLTLWVVTAFDVAVPGIDIGWVTGPAATFTSALLGIFQLGVTSPNVPTD